MRPAAWDEKGVAVRNRKPDEERDEGAQLRQDASVRQRLTKKQLAVFICRRMLQKRQARR
jgi:hypothetical protein